MYYWTYTKHIPANYKLRYIISVVMKNSDQTVYLQVDGDEIKTCPDKAKASKYKDPINAMCVVNSLDTNKLQSMTIEVLF